MRALLLLAFLAGCGCEPAPPPDPAPEPEGDPKRARANPAPTQERVGTVRFQGLKIKLPESWTKDSKPHGSQLLLFGPKDDGFKPSVQLEWKKSELPLEKWAQINVEKYDNPKSVAVVHEKGWTKLDGRRAFRMVYELTERDPNRDGKPARFMFCDWYIQKDGHVGMLRGLARQEDFGLRYRPFFDRVAETLRYPSR
ncbi:MAG: hypothetical protein AAGD14_06790 [Planctomycetota bacterium]